MGGHLYLTRQRLAFEALGFNVQRGDTVVGSGEVPSLQPSWTKFLGVFPGFPHSLPVHPRQGREHPHNLVDRSTWAHAFVVALAT